jgi:GNAT superfamily N-acetyltransferase
MPKKPLPSGLLTLPEPLRPMPRFLLPGASAEQLVQAAAENHLSWFGGDLRLENGVHWKDGLIAFPRIPASITGAVLDTIVDYHRKCPPQEIACWSLTPTQPHDLGARLVARGFDWGWKPHWMALDLHHIQSDFPMPEDLRIVVEDAPEWEVEDLPYYTRRSPESEPLKAPSGPRRRWHFGAYLDGKIVGQSVLNVTTGKRGVAGIYNVGVVPAARNQGVGRAISLAACQYAEALGCHYALLNAATHIYERIGFVSLGYGQTWFLHKETLVAPPPTPVQVAYFEAVGRGASALERLYHQGQKIDLDVPLTSGMTLMSLAVRMRKLSSIRWLMAHGATLDIVLAWDLGWKEKARELLLHSPELASRPAGTQGLTPLHAAAMHNDIELARLVLSAKPDLTLRDRQYNGTPLNWAEVLGRPEIAALIQEVLGT